MLKINSDKTLFWLIILLPLLYFPLFGHLGVTPLNNWDEARLAVNAHEMHISGDWLVTSYYHKPEMWNTKPPLMIWLQVLFIKILGENEFAIRFPSALAGLGTCMLLFWFFVKKYKRPVLGFLTCIILISCESFVRHHGTRTGDYDSVLTFFTTSFLLCWFLYLTEGKTKYFYLFIATLTLATLTKGVQPLIFLPGIVIYTIYRRKLLGVLKSFHSYLGLMMFATIALGYYLAREHYNPGYIDAVFANELGGRFNQTLEHHEGKFWFYTGQLERNEFYFWYVLALLGLIVSFGATQKNSIRHIAILTAIAAATYLFVISLAGTKCYWYDIPAIPLLSILAAIFLDTFFSSLKLASSRHLYLSYLLCAVVYLLVPYRPAFEIGTGEKEHVHSWENWKAGQFFQQALKGEEDVRGYYIVHSPNPDQNHFWYLELLVDNKGVKTCGTDHLKPGYKVITFEPGTERALEENWDFDFLGSWQNVKRYYIKGKKNFGKIQ